MKFLKNISNSVWDLNLFEQDWNNVEAFLKDHKLDGIEMILHEEEFLDTMPEELPVGLHLRYYPTWLEFYNGDMDKVRTMFKDDQAIEACFGGLHPNNLVNIFKKEYDKAKKLNVSYMVYHVSHVTNEHAYTFNFDYTDEDVLNATADLINKAFDEDSEIELLFENLWWPGLTLLDAEKVKIFMDKIKYKNKGIMLDLSHLMITNPNIETLKEGTEYILSVLSNLGDMKDYIKGIHVNKSLPGQYLKEDHQEKYEAFKVIEDELESYLTIIGHIKKMDWHIPFDYEGIKEIIKTVNPKYVVYEVLSKDLEELNSFMAIQNEALGR